MIKFLSALILLLVTTAAQAERIRDLTSVQGVRQNSLIGYGLVVGLDGTGDQTTQTPFTTQTFWLAAQEPPLAVAVFRLTN